MHSYVARFPRSCLRLRLLASPAHVACAALQSYVAGARGNQPEMLSCLCTMFYFVSSGFAHQNLETLFELIIKKCEIVQLTLQLQLPTLCFVRAVNCIVFALCLHPYDFVFPLLRLSGGWVGLFARFAPRVVLFTHPPTTVQNQHKDLHFWPYPQP